MGDAAESAVEGPLSPRAAQALEAMRYQTLDESGAPTGLTHVIDGTTPGSEVPHPLDQILDREPLPDDREAWHRSILDAAMAARDARVRRARSVYEEEENQAQAEFNEAVDREFDRYLAERLAAKA